MRNIGAVILAAGGSSRFGQPKQLARFRGKSLIRHAIDVARDAGCSPVIVVAGRDARQIAGEVDVEVMENEEWKRGIGTSIRSGMRRLIKLTTKSPDVSGVVLLVCDQPFVEAGTIKRLIAEGEATGKAIVASTYADTLGVPALFGRACFNKLLALPDDTGAKDLIMRGGEEVARVPFPEGNFDIDTVEDLEQLAMKA
jgi:molybdenum cofactor cytidylyltransferase